MRPRVEGIIPIACVPFDEREDIDQDALRAEARFLVDRGVQAIGIGFGSELPRLTEDERGTVLKALVDEAAGRVPIMASTGADGTVAAVRRSEVAARLGAQLLMVVPPAQAGASPDAIVDHYASIAKHVPIPIVIQDAPASTGVRMSPALIGRIAREVPTVAAVKVEELPSAPKVEATVREVGPALSVLGGAGGQDFFNELTRGASGTIPVALDIPRSSCASWRGIEQGKLTRVGASGPDTCRSCTCWPGTWTRSWSRRRGSCAGARSSAPIASGDPGYRRMQRSWLLWRWR
jgi:2-keto-3-deoxy-L-arabinonate dehydratase